MTRPLADVPEGWVQRGIDPDVVLPPAADTDPGWAAFTALREAVEGIAADHWDWKAGTSLHNAIRALLASHPPSPVAASPETDIPPTAMSHNPAKGDSALREAVEGLHRQAARGPNAAELEGYCCHDNQSWPCGTIRLLAAHPPSPVEATVVEEPKPHHCCDCWCGQHHAREDFL